MHHDEVLRDFFDEIRYVDHLESVDAIPRAYGADAESHSICFVNAGVNTMRSVVSSVLSSGIPGMQRNQAEAVRNKWMMKQMLHQRGIRTSEIAIALHEQDYIRFTAVHGFPIIVKPLSGYGSINTFKLSSMDELVHYLHRTRQAQQRDLLEELIHGTGVSL